MNIRNVKNSTGIIAGITGLLFAPRYVGLEILNEKPEAANSIRVCLLDNQPVAEVYKCLNQLLNS